MTRQERTDLNLLLYGRVRSSRNYTNEAYPFDFDTSASPSAANMARIKEGARQLFFDPAYQNRERDLEKRLSMAKIAGLNIRTLPLYMFEALERLAATEVTPAIS